MAFKVSEVDQIPPDTVELKVVVPLEHIDCIPLKVPGIGLAVTNIVLVFMESAQPLVPVTLYVIIAEPADTGVTTPVSELIVATVVFPEVQVPPKTVELNIELPLEHMD